MNIPILIALLGALIVVLLVVRSRQAPKRERAHRRSGARASQSARRRPEAPYVSASLRGMSQESESRPRRTSGLG